MVTKEMTITYIYKSELTWVKKILLNSLKIEYYQYIKSHSSFDYRYRYIKPVLYSHCVFYPFVCFHCPSSVFYSQKEKKKMYKISTTTTYLVTQQARREMVCTNTETWEVLVFIHRFNLKHKLVTIPVYLTYKAPT